MKILKHQLVTILFIAACLTTFAQVGIGTTTPEGALDVASANQGFLPPRVASSDAVTTPVNGMIIYDLSKDCFNFYERDAWSGCKIALLEGEVYSAVTGKVWMDKNLGATQVATSSTDADAYGDLYQWGRNTDGHEIRTSGTTAGPVTSGTEGINFITVPNVNNDWLSVSDNTRWNGATKGSEDPCPSGYRVPTEAEWTAELPLFPSGNAIGYRSVLKLPVAGFRNDNTGSLGVVGTYGYYWTSTVSGSSHHNLFLTDTSVSVSGSKRSRGLSVRCIKE